MADLSKMSGQGIDWPVGGKVYKLSPVKLKEMGAFTQWVENKYIKDMTKVAENLPEGKQNEFLVEALKKTPTGIELSIKVGEAMVTIEGTKELIYISLKKHHSDITREEVNKIVTFENLKLAQDLLDKTSGFKKTKKNKEGKEDTKKKALSGK